MRSVVYIENELPLHLEWEEVLGVQFKKLGVETIHCSGFAKFNDPPPNLEFFDATELLVRVSGTPLSLVVTDVWMADPVRGDQRGGKNIVRQLVQLLGDGMPPVLIVSGRPESDFGKELERMGVHVLGAIALRSDYRQQEHWNRIRTYVLQACGLSEGKATIYAYNEKMKLGSTVVYRNLSVHVHGARESATLKAWSVGSFALQLMAGTPREEWSNRDIIKLIERSRNSILSETDGEWEFLAEANWRDVLDDRLRVALNSLRERFPSVIAPASKGTNMCVADISWEYGTPPKETSVTT